MTPLTWALCLLIADALQYLILSLLAEMLLPASGFLAIYAIQLIVVVPFAILIDKLYNHLNPAQKAVLIHGNEKKAGKYSSRIDKHRNKFEIGRSVSQDEPAEKLLGYLRESETVFFLDVDEKIREPLLEFCFHNNKRTYILPTFSGVLINTAGVSWISNTPMFLPKSPEPDLSTRFVKRCMDVAVSLLAIILFSCVPDKGKGGYHRFGANLRSV